MHKNDRSTLLDLVSHFILIFCKFKPSPVFEVIASCLQDIVSVDLASVIRLKIVTRLTQLDICMVHVYVESYFFGL